MVFIFVIVSSQPISPHVKESNYVEGNTQDFLSKSLGFQKGYEPTLGTSVAPPIVTARAALLPS